MQTESIAIPSHHAVFEGHFPGRPIVPGAVLLDLILAACSRPVSAVSSAKFHQPVMPGDVLTLSFAPGARASALTFTCRRDETLVCSGVLLSDSASI